MDFINLFQKMFSVNNLLGNNMPLYAVALSAVGVYLLLFLLEGIGLYQMAAKQNVNHRWQAFVPFANTYLIGRLAGVCPFWGKNIKRIHVWLLLTEIVAFLFSASYFTFQLLAMYTTTFSEVQYFTTEVISGIEIQSIHFSNAGLEAFNNVMPLVTNLFDIVYFFFLIIALVNLFRKYSARRGLTITMWCVIGEVFVGVPLQGIFLFAMRNNKPVDYAEYIKRKQAEFIRQQQAYRNQNPMNNPYDYYSPRPKNPNPSEYRYDPYTGQPISRDNSSDGQEPFSDLGGKNDGSSDDPFSL